MLIQRLNLENINSKLIKNLTDIYDNIDNIEIPNFIDINELQEFNNRIINPVNFNNIINMLDFLDVDSKEIELFIIKNSIPTNENYILSFKNNIKYNLPNFMITEISSENDQKDICKYGLLEWIKYTQTNYPEIKEKTIDFIVEFGHIDCLIYCHQNNYNWDQITTSTAATYGNLNCLEYAYNNGCDIDLISSWGAAENGHLDCLKFIYNNCVGWDENTFEFAVLGGNIDCIKYLHKMNCPYTPDIFYCSLEQGNIKCLEYISKNILKQSNNVNINHYQVNYNIPRWSLFPFIFLIKNGNLTCIKYLHDINWIEPIEIESLSLFFEDINDKNKLYNILDCIIYLINKKYIDLNKFKDFKFNKLSTIISNQIIKHYINDNL